MLLLLVLTTIADCARGAVSIAVVMLLLLVLTTIADCARGAVSITASACAIAAITASACAIGAIAISAYARSFPIAATATSACANGISIAALTTGDRGASSAAGIFIAVVSANCAHGIFAAAVTACPCGRFVAVVAVQLVAYCTCGVSIVVFTICARAFFSFGNVTYVYGFSSIVTACACACTVAGIVLAYRRSTAADCSYAAFATSASDFIAIWSIRRRHTCSLFPSCCLRLVTADASLEAFFHISLVPLPGWTTVLVPCL